MPFFHLNLKFKNKLLFIFLLFSILPLVLVALLVYQRVQTTYRQTLEESFRRNAQARQQILMLFLENNRSWLKTLASQDILLEMLSQQLTAENPEANGEEEKVFANLNSIKRENPFIERLYVLDSSGEVIVSTATNDIGTKVEKLPFVTIPLKERRTYIGNIIISPYQKRVIPISAPLMRRSDNQVIGVLVADLNSSVIQALFEGKLFLQPDQQFPQTEEIEAYVVDNDGYPLTKLKYEAKQETITVQPVYECLTHDKSLSGIWESYFGEKVIGLSQCLKLDGLAWTVVIEEPTSAAFAVSRQLGLTIILITLGTAVLLFFTLIPISRSITTPIRKLISGAQFVGRGNLDYRINLKTGDELEGLASSFNEMASRLKSLVSDLTKEKDTLKVQKERLDQSAKLLLRRDLELRETNDELETKKNLAEAEKNKFKVVLEGITDGVIAVDLERKVITFNRSAELITGYNTKEVIGRHIGELIKLYEGDREIKTDEYCLVSENSYEGVVFSKRDIKLSGANNKISFINIASGQIKEGLSIKLGCIITFHDITQERNLERMRLDFVSLAAHDLRAPLTTIQGYLSFLKQESTLEKLNPDEKEYINRAVSGTSTLSKLIQNLMVVSRIEEGEIVMDKRQIQLEDLVRKTTEEYQGLATSKGLELSCHIFPEKLPSIFADPIRVGEVLSNLISNAISYTQKGKVIVSTKLEGNNLITSISDTGQGIPEEAFSRLFTKFFRVKGLIEIGSKGTGLGLFISKNIIEANGGKIWAKSKLNEGSTFSFSLPIAIQKES